MAIEESLKSLLSGVAGGRTYWGRGEGINQTAGPYLVLTHVGGPRDYNMAGDSGYIPSRVQVDVFGETFGEVRDAASSAITALSGYRGTVSGTVIQGIFIDSVRDLDATDAGEVSHLFRRSIDCIVHHDG